MTARNRLGSVQQEGDVQQAPGEDPFREADGILADPALVPEARARLLLNLCRAAEAMAPDRADRYWSSFLPVRSALHKGEYKELAQEHGEDPGRIPTMLARVAAAKRMMASAEPERTGRELALVEVQIGERRAPVGKGRVYGALADAWLAIDRAHAIGLLGAMPLPSQTELVKSAAAQQSLSQDEWRVVSSTVGPARCAELATAALEASETRVAVPAELVEAIGSHIRSRTGSDVTTLRKALDAHEALVASLAAEGRTEEAAAEIDRLFSWATTVPQVVQGPSTDLAIRYLRFAVIERVVNEAAAFGRIPDEDSLTARIEQARAPLQAFVRTLYRAKATTVGGVDAGFRRLAHELSAEALQRGPHQPRARGGNPAKLAERGHREAALRLYLMRVALDGMAGEALDVAARTGVEDAYMAVVRQILTKGDDGARVLLPADNFDETSIERFLALGTAQERAAHLERITRNGTRVIPGNLWRDWDAASSMPSGLLSGKPRHESLDEYLAHNPIYPSTIPKHSDEDEFLGFVRSISEYDHRDLDKALLSALVAWSERDWERASNCMEIMWDSIVPSDELLHPWRSGNVTHDGPGMEIIPRACFVLAAEPDVLARRVLPWLHTELVVKGRTWLEGNTRFTVKLSDGRLAELYIAGALALARTAPQTRDDLVAIALGYAGGAEKVIRELAGAYMAGRRCALAPPPVALDGRNLATWQDGVVQCAVPGI